MHPWDERFLLCQVDNCARSACDEIRERLKYDFCCRQPAPKRLKKLNQMLSVCLVCHAKFHPVLHNVMYTKIAREDIAQVGAQSQVYPANHCAFHMNIPLQIQSWFGTTSVSRNFFGSKVLATTCAKYRAARLFALAPEQVASKIGAGTLLQAS